MGGFWLSDLGFALHVSEICFKLETSIRASIRLVVASGVPVGVLGSAFVPLICTS